MKITAHCFAENASINPTSFAFKFKEFDARLYSLDGNLTLQISKKATEDELTKIKRDPNQSDMEQALENKMKPYKLVLTEVSQLLEGLFSILYISIPPKFNTDRIVVNLYAETDEEQHSLDNDTITRFFGHVFMPQNKPSYKMDDSIIDLIEPSLNHLPAFSFFAQATRSWESNDNEIAFFLFFRIIDGYFSDGASAVETALLKKINELKTYIPYEDELKNSTISILTEMGIPSKSQINYEGLISDIVLIRHKLTHFSSTNAKSHHSPTIKFELFTLNSYLYKACFSVLRDKIDDTKIS